MRYIRKYEDSLITHDNVLQVNNIDTNKVYTYDHSGNKFIGKLYINKTSGITYNYMMSKYTYHTVHNIEKDKIYKTIISRTDLPYMSESTPEETEYYEIVSNTNKYNI